MSQIPTNRTAKLFVYGHLKDDESRPKTTSAYEIAHLHGRMWLRQDGEKDGDPALQDAGDTTAPIVEGLLLTIDPIELPYLDSEETPQYRRETAVTTEGDTCWVYVFRGRRPTKARLLTKWPEK